MLDTLLQHRAELSRALRNHHYERVGDGRLYFPRAGLTASGVFTTRVNGGDERIEPNAMLYAGLDDILKVYFAQSAQRTAFYIALFSGNVTPPPDMTAATFPSLLTEFTNYTEAARPAWAKDAVASQHVGNSTTPARFTIGSGGGTVWGATMSIASAKGSTSGLIPCSSKFGAKRDLLEADKFDVEYAVSASDGTP